MNQINIGNISVDVVKKDIKNLHLAVYPPSGRVRIAAPLRVKDEAIRLCAISRIPWIRKHQTKFRAQERQTPREYVSGESHYYKGKRYLLNVIYHDAPPRVIIRNKKYIDLYVRPGSSQAKRGEVMIEWYRQQLKAVMPVLIHKWEKETGIRVNDWQVKQMKVKWGTCNIKAKRIWINLELIKKPELYLEYIILHEMLHLLERTHNERYKEHLSKFMPHWRLYKEELNRFIL